MLKSYECTFPDTEDKLKDFILGFNNGKRNVENECAIEMLDLFYREVYPPPKNIEDYWLFYRNVGFLIIWAIILTKSYISQ
jgi:hypothetical protein